MSPLRPIDRYLALLIAATIARRRHPAPTPLERAVLRRLVARRIAVAHRTARAAKRPTQGRYRRRRRWSGVKTRLAGSSSSDRHASATVSGSIPASPAPTSVQMRSSSGWVRA
jgi:hypothetical protein